MNKSNKDEQMDDEVTIDKINKEVDNDTAYTKSTPTDSRSVYKELMVEGITESGINYNALIELCGDGFIIKLYKSKDGKMLPSMMKIFRKF